MNVIQLQDLLRGLPDDRLKQELSQPTGTVPQYLVLSEVVRRDKIRESNASAPQTTVVQDIIGTPQPAQQQPQAFANGGFISPAQSMANAGVRGFAPQAPKPPIQFGMNNSAPQMFTPNTTPPPPAPVTTNNISVQAPTVNQPQPQFDGGQNDGPNAPSYYEQPNGYADGGIIGLADGDFTSRLIGAESSFDPKAKNPRSSAGGLGQFIDSTWLQYLRETQPGLVDRIGEKAALKLKEDPKLSTNAVEWYKDKNTGVLQSAGYEPSEGNLYLAHFLGGQGAKNILGADPTTPAVDILGEKVVNANPFLRGMSAADVINWSSKKIGGSPTQPSITMASMNPADREAGILSGGVMPDPKKRGIGTLFAEAMGSPDVKKDMRDLGASLFAKSQEQQVIDPPPMQRGDPTLVKGIGGPSVEEILAQAKAIRAQYMASGGVVKMRDGSPGEIQPTATPSYDPYAVLGISKEDALKMSPYDYRTKVFLPPEKLSTMTPAQVEEYNKAWKDVGSELREKVWSKGGYGAGASTFETLVPRAAEIGVEKADRAIRESAAAGILSPFVPTETRIEAAKSITEEDNQPRPVRGSYDSERRLPQGGEPANTSAQLFSDDFRATPNQLFVAQREAEKAARLKAEKEAEANRPTAFDEYISYLKDRDEQLAALYQEQADEERRRQEEAGGLPFLLRQLGIGMIASGGNLQQGLRGGLEQAFKAREEQTQAARDRIRELQLKGKMVGIEGLGDIAKLQYEASVEAAKAAREGRAGQKDYLSQLDDIGRLIADREDKVEESNGDIATDPLLQQYRAIQRELMQKGGLSGNIGSAPYVYDPAQKGITPR